MGSRGLEIKLEFFVDIYNILFLYNKEKSLSVLVYWKGLNFKPTCRCCGAARGTQNPPSWNPPSFPLPQCQQFVQRKDQFFHGFVHVVWGHQQFTDPLQRPRWLNVVLQRLQQLLSCLFSFVRFSAVAADDGGEHATVGGFHVPAPDVLVDVFFQD